MKYIIIFATFNVDKNCKMLIWALCGAIVDSHKRVVVQLGWWRREAGSREGNVGDWNGPLFVGILKLKLACLCDLQHSYRHKHNHMTVRGFSEQSYEAKLIRGNRKQFSADWWFIMVQSRLSEGPCQRYCETEQNDDCNILMRDVSIASAQKLHII